MIQYSTGEKSSFSLNCADWIWNPPVSYSMGTGDLSPGVKRSGLVADHSSRAKVKNEWSYTATAAMFVSFAGFDRVPCSSHLELCLQLGLVTPGFLNKILRVFLISPNRAVCPLSHPCLCNT